MTVRVFSRADPSVPVKLYLNGEEVAATDPWSEAQDDPCCIGQFDYGGAFWSTPFSTTFVVPYAAGNLTAVVGDDVRTLVTAGAPVGLRLTPDRDIINADRSDLAYMTVEVGEGREKFHPTPSTPARTPLTHQPPILRPVPTQVVDAYGRIVPNAVVDVSLTVTEGSEGELAAAGSGNPEDARSFQSNACTTFNGRCMAILRPGSASKPPVVNGVIKLTASAHEAGLVSSSATVATA